MLPYFGFQKTSGRRKTNSAGRLLVAAAFAAALIAGAPALAQQTFTVDRLTDAGEGDGLVGDLRYCITNATDGDSITFAVTGTINLTRALPDLTRSISIEGPGANLLTVRRNTGDDYRIIIVMNGTVRISGLTIANGVAAGSGGGGGGGVYNQGTLIVNGSTISGNVAGIDCLGGNGGGVFNRGALTISNSTISGNFVGSYSIGCALGYGAASTTTTRESSP